MLSPEVPCRAGRLRFLVHTSAVLAGNRLGDPVERHHPVYLPPGYDDDPNRTYPVLFALAGYTSTGMHFFSPGTFSESLHDRLDRLIEARELDPCIVVAPDCMTRLGGSQYLNGAAGAYQDLLVQELVPLVRQELRVPPGPMGVFGKSSGGFGALHLGMRSPDIFSAVACHSGDATFEISILPEIPTLVRALDRFEGDGPQKVSAFLEYFERKPKRSYSDGHALMMLACAAAYSPNPGSPLGYDLPCDATTGRLDDPVWQRWLARDPVRCAAEHAPALRSLDELFLDCGSRDQYGLQLGARQLHAEFTRLNVPHEYQEFDDDHSGTNYRYDTSLPRLVAALTRRRP